MGAWAVEQAHVHRDAAALKPARNMSNVLNAGS